MAKIIILIVLLILVALVIVISVQPADFRISRSATIAAPPSAVFPHVNDLHRWEAWSPWAKLDPAMKQTYEGSPAGLGAITSWTGNGKVGEGRMTILESRPDELVRIKLEFLKPFTATNEAEFTFKPEGSGTLVTWTMTGRNNFISKAMGLVMNMEKVIGGQFDQGLGTLKSVAETR